MKILLCGSSLETPVQANVWAVDFRPPPEPGLACSVHLYIKEVEIPAANKANIWPIGPMARRLTTNQEVCISPPAPRINHTDWHLLRLQVVSSPNASCD